MTTLKLVQDKPDEAIVGALEEALEAARAGRVKALLLVTYDAGERVACTRIGNRAELVYAIEHAKLRTLQE